MKQYIFIFISIFLYSCNYAKTEKTDVSIIEEDTLYERKIPILIFGNEELQRELDSIVEKEINCYYYKKDTTNFGIWARVLEKDTLFGISSGNRCYIDFSKTGFDKGKRIDGVYGYFKYKNFDFFCYTSCMKFTDLFHETTDSMKVKNSPLLYIEYESEIDDSRTDWGYIYKDKKLVEFGFTY